MVKQIYYIMFKKRLLQAIEELNLRQSLGAFIYRIKRNPNVDKKIILNYFKKNKTFKLYIGCSLNILDGWLNSDYRSPSENVLHLDATCVFPFRDNQFDFIFSEHMIEHISFSQGRFMLSECFRVLKNGGKVRISTPDLHFLINLHQNSISKLQQEYINWMTDRFCPNAPYPDPTFVTNEYVRAWGHTFIYDERTLRSSLENAGFTEIVRCNLNCSPDPALRDLENDARMPAGFLALETITLEARKLVAPRSLS